jgi:hypothetical protein
MDKYECAICNTTYAYVITNPITNKELLICKAHYDHIDAVKNLVLTELIKNKAVK